ncbi:hypothetical protein IVA79_26845 [Bradyrhizobium sp. 138]|uniref:hypothetical protein n=1 Tax=Bradyrhizobium sp. 138 TaxID=2782615 RepID=UPI001FF92C96|nr:hypothetical protein [Bradyrhizobium sp. 138]MCK1737502.1 hypothetical protein [Bradyrhizobium sp. 138]
MTSKFAFNIGDHGSRSHFPFELLAGIPQLDVHDEGIPAVDIINIDDTGGGKARAYPVFRVELADPFNWSDEGGMWWILATLYRAGRKPLDALAKRVKFERVRKQDQDVSGILSQHMETRSPPLVFVDGPRQFDL